MSDLDLLQQYIRAQSQDAFTALVRRHINLVYSAAFRQLRSPHLAEEATQSVFLDLARHASRLAPAQPLAPWLFLVTRRTAIDFLRRESRRIAREQAAAEIAAMTTVSPSWLGVRDVLDEALENLDETDRSALLLRFFEGRSLREVGAALCISEDTAQKRVSRALERLRRLLARRNVAASVSTLAADLPAHAVEAAPETLLATLSSPSFVALASTTPITGGVQLMGWATVQKSAAVLIGAGLLAVIGFETLAAARAQRALAALPHSSAHVAASLAATHAAHADVTHRLAAARSALADARRLGAIDSEADAAIAGWLARLQRLKHLAASRPDLQLPELDMLDEKHWFAAARDARLDSEPEIRATFKAVHHDAREEFAHKLDGALDRFVLAHEGRLPDSPRQLAPFATPPIPFALLDEFELQQHGILREIPPEAWILAERPARAARHGNRIYVSRTQRGTEEFPAKSTAP